MNKLTIFLSRFIVISLIIPHMSLAIDTAPVSQNSFFDTAEPTLIETKTLPKDATSSPQSLTAPQDSPKNNELFSTQGALQTVGAKTRPDQSSSDSQQNGLPQASSKDTLNTIPSTALSSQSTIVDAKTIANTTLPLHEQAQIQPTLEFNYVNEDIINIINTLATKKGVNVIIPLGANAIANKVTLSLPNRITLDAAWSLLQTLLDMSGYSMIPRGDMYYITKKNTTVAKEPLPLFVGMKPSELPDTDERIRFVYYLSNIKVSNAPESELAVLLKELLSPDAAFKMDPPSNGLIISARSREIKSLMEIIIKLDKIGFLEKFEIFKLRFTNAKDVADLFNNSILKTEADPNRYRLDTKSSSDATYFSKFIRIIPDDRTNSLIILGRFQAIERIKEFIRNYVDIRIESGKSPVHVYDLEYLNAKDLADILTKIIKAGADAGTGQSQAGGMPTGGIQRQFGDVQIMADTPPEQAGDATKDESAPRYYGGNKLIIACGSDDWREIEKLIQDLDQPKAQVLIEVLIADMTLDDIRALGTSIRNPGNIPLPGNMSFQTTNLGNEKFITQGDYPNTTLKADLLKTTLPVPSNAYASFAGEQPNGSMVLSFNDPDGKVWGVADILNNIGSLKVLSAPHIIATNNKKAIIERTEERLLRDQSSPSGGSTSIAFQFKPATLSVEITPRISESDDVNMQITIKVNEFVKTADNPDPQTPVRRTREITANATITNNNILVLGGLAKLGDTEGSNETPLLSKIPLIGWLFKSKANAVQKANLSIFIKPIIIRPRLRSGLQEHTQELLSYIDNYTGQQGGLFSNMKDPVTRLFFSSSSDSNGLVSDFMRFKKEEFTRTMGAPTQNIDLTKNNSTNKTPEPKIAPLKNSDYLSDGLVDEPKEKSELEATPSTTEPPQASERLDNNDVINNNGTEEISKSDITTKEPQIDRAERAKELLKNSENPLIL